jgi:hypothetical protein
VSSPKLLTGFRWRLLRVKLANLFVALRGPTQSTNINFNLYETQIEVFRFSQNRLQKQKYVVTDTNLFLRFLFQAFLGTVSVERTALRSKEFLSLPNCGT